MKLSAKEVIEKIESGELGWNDIEDLEITDPENLDELKTYAKNNSTGEKSKKIRMNALYGALDNESFPLHNRNISGSITLIGRFSIQYTSKLVQELLEKMFGPGEYIIYNDTDSGYFTLAPLVHKILEKKSKSYNELTPEDKKEIIETLLKFIQKKIEPLLEDLFHIFEDEFNIYTRGFFGFKVEKIAEKGIFVAKKRYALKPIWSEGSYFLDKAKLSVTGLDIVRSSTPDFVIDKLSEALIIIMDKDESAIRNYVDEVKKEFFQIADKHPELVAKTSGVSSLDYQQDSKGWCRYTPEGRRIPAPINSRAAILHNKLIKEKNLTDAYEPIAEGDKIKFVMLTLPNPINENVFGFKDEKVLFDTGLVKYLDKEQMFETNFLQPLKLILEVLNIDLNKKAIDFDGW